MRTLIFSAVVLAVALVRLNALISASLVSARDAKANSFSERFAARKSASCAARVGHLKLLIRG